MECGDQMLALFHQHRIAFILCQNAHFGTGAADDGRPDEDSFHVARARALLEIRSRMDVRHAAVDLAAIARCARRSDRSRRSFPGADCSTSFASRIAPAQVPKTGFSRANWRRGSLRSMKFRSLSMVVLSPPGITSPSMFFSSSAVRTCTASAPARSSAFACASKSPCSARTPTRFLARWPLYQPRVCISSPSGSLEMSRPGMAIPRSSLASSSFSGSL